MSLRIFNNQTLPLHSSLDMRLFPSFLPLPFPSSSPLSLSSYYFSSSSSFTVRGLGDLAHVFSGFFRLLSPFCTFFLLILLFLFSFYFLPSFFHVFIAFFRLLYFPTALSSFLLFLVSYYFSSLLLHILNGFLDSVFTLSSFLFSYSSSPLHSSSSFLWLLGLSILLHLLPSYSPVPLFSSSFFTVTGLRDLIPCF